MLARLFSPFCVALMRNRGFLCTLGEHLEATLRNGHFLDLWIESVTPAGMFVAKLNLLKIWLEFLESY